jgi:hypothetical protein
MIGLKNGKNFGVVGRQKRGKKDGKICGWQGGFNDQRTTVGQFRGAKISHTMILFKDVDLDGRARHAVLKRKNYLCQWCHGNCHTASEATIAKTNERFFEKQNKRLESPGGQCLFATKHLTQLKDGGLIICLWDNF